MTEPDDEQIEHPATWENVVVGKAKEVVGRMTGAKDLEEEGEEQEEVAHEVRDEFDEDHKH
jgi:uncharacterized protein YjbJ (UPF0337 family)